MAFGWESESYPEAKDLAVLPLFAFFFYAARLFLDSFIFEVTLLNFNPCDVVHVMFSELYVRGVTDFRWPIRWDFDFLSLLKCSYLLFGSIAVKYTFDFEIEVMESIWNWMEIALFWLVLYGE